MEAEKVLDFVETVNSFREGFCEVKDNILYIFYKKQETDIEDDLLEKTNVNDTDESEDTSLNSMSIEISDIESISFTKKKFKGAEIFIKSISNKNNILAYLFENRLQNICFTISTFMDYFYIKYFWYVACFVFGLATSWILFKLF